MATPSTLQPPPAPPQSSIMCPSATGLLALLNEPTPLLQKTALKRLLPLIHTQWHEVAPLLPDLEALAEGRSEGSDEELKRLAAGVASRVFYYLEEETMALKLALDSDEHLFAGVGNTSVNVNVNVNGEAFQESERIYMECLIGAAVDAYVSKKKLEFDGITSTTTSTSTSTTSASKKEELDQLSMSKLQSVVQIMFERCYQDRTYQHALGVALEAREASKVKEILDHCHASPSTSTSKAEFFALLQWTLEASLTLVGSKSLRVEVVQVLAANLEALWLESCTAMKMGNGNGNTRDQVAKSCAFTLATALQVLRTAKPVAEIIQTLLEEDAIMNMNMNESSDVEKNDDCLLLALQLCFDLVESGDQNFVNAVAEFVKKGADADADESTDENETKTNSNSAAAHGQYKKALKILTGGFSSELAISFLHKNTDSDPLIMENLRANLEHRSSGRNSMLHNCAVLTHSYLNAGTTNDGFLRDNLEWMKKASNWAKFSATASLGVVHAGHITEAMTLLEPYLPTNPSSENAQDSPVTDAGGYAEGGSLYALGLIHGSHAGSCAVKKNETKEFLQKHLRVSHVNEPISHGAALGLGLTAMGTNDLEAILDLKELIYTDSAVAGEGAGIAIGLVLVGSGAGNVRNNLDPSVNQVEEINEVMAELKTYAKETQHEKIIRGIVMGIALANYGQEENADYIIDEMRKDRDPIMRYGAQYALSLAYCGTGSNKAVRLLLHTAVSDVSDDVRMAAVIGLAFVLYKTPKRVPELVKLLLESFNPHVRYASCMAVGIAMAGSGDAESVAMLEPMLSDMTDYVRQGALLGTAFIYMQQGDNCNDRKIKSFREKVASLVGDKHQASLTKMGAIMATGIMDAGGRNCSFDLGSKNGFTKMSSAVGVALWLQHWYWFPMMHMFSLAITPTYTIGLNSDLNYPRKFEIKCDSKPSAFAYPKRLEEKKEEKKKRVETVTLSTTAKSKARTARKKGKENKKDAELPEADSGSGSKESMNVDDGEEVAPAPTEGTKEEKKPKKKREPETNSFLLSNPSRITKAQAAYCRFELDQRYRPIRVAEKPCGVILLTDSTPDEEADIGTVKPPSIESEDEADAPEPFEWSPSGAADTSATVANSAPSSSE